MMNKKNTCVLLSALVVSLGGCAKDIPSQAYANRGSAESLLDVSSEIVTVDLSGDESLAELTKWVEGDQPTRAEILCAEGDVRCDQAEQTLSLYNVKSEWLPSQTSEVNLIYERVIARDCENRYIDNRINPYHFNHPAFGCSVASNMVQMVADRQQFTNPSLLGLYDGSTAYKNIKNYKAFDSKTYFKKESADISTLDFQSE
jgi:type IV pilus biogenesis protein CpaD/CtpE